VVKATLQLTSLHLNAGMHSKAKLCTYTLACNTVLYRSITEVMHGCKAWLSSISCLSALTAISHACEITERHGFRFLNRKTAPPSQPYQQEAPQALGGASREVVLGRLLSAPACGQRGCTAGLSSQCRDHGGVKGVYKRANQAAPEVDGPWIRFTYAQRSPCKPCETE
jgi:hypothetical protein